MSCCASRTGDIDFLFRSVQPFPSRAVHFLFRSVQHFLPQGMLSSFLFISSSKRSLQQFFFRRCIAASPISGLLLTFLWGSCVCLFANAIALLCVRGAWRHTSHTSLPIASRCAPRTAPQPLPSWATWKVFVICTALGLSLFYRIYFASRVGRQKITFKKILW